MAVEPKDVYIIIGVAMTCLLIGLIFAGNKAVSGLGLKCYTDTDNQTNPPTIECHRPYQIYLEKIGWHLVGLVTAILLFMLFSVLSTGYLFVKDPKTVQVMVVGTILLIALAAMDIVGILNNDSLVEDHNKTNCGCLAPSAEIQQMMEVGIDRMTPDQFPGSLAMGLYASYGAALAFVIIFFSMLYLLFSTGSSNSTSTSTSTQGYGSSNSTFKL